MAVLFLFIAMVFAMTACGRSAATPTPASSPAEDAARPAETPAETAATDAGAQAEDQPTDSKILVAYFSRAGENYGVGVIEKGNTRIIAEMIAEETGAELFEIARATPYPESYDECTEEAKQEQSDNARPELTAAVEGFEDYDAVFLGYPNWWGDMPMPVYTFIEGYDFSGKTVIPFCTHAGSGLSNTVSAIQDVLTDATVLEGLAIPGTTAQNQQDEARRTVTGWLEGLKELTL